MAGVIYAAATDPSDRLRYLAGPDAQRLGPLRVMADIARHIETACRDLDLELLASLLHPQVRWATCNTSDEVLD